MVQAEGRRLDNGFGLTTMPGNLVDWPTELYDNLATPAVQFLVNPMNP